jgi:hypothetical protein
MPNRQLLFYLEYHGHPHIFVGALLRFLTSNFLFWFQKRDLITLQIFLNLDFLLPYHTELTDTDTICQIIF